MLILKAILFLWSVQGGPRNHELEKHKLEQKELKRKEKLREKEFKEEQKRLQRAHEFRLREERTARTLELKREREEKKLAAKRKSFEESDFEGEHPQFGERNSSMIHAEEGKGQVVQTGKLKERLQRVKDKISERHLENKENMREFSHDQLEKIKRHKLKFVALTLTIGLVIGLSAALGVEVEKLKHINDVALPAPCYDDQGVSNGTCGAKDKFDECGNSIDINAFEALSKDLQKELEERNYAGGPCFPNKSDFTANSFMGCPLASKVGVTYSDRIDMTDYDPINEKTDTRYYYRVKPSGTSSSNLYVDCHGMYMTPDGDEGDVNTLFYFTDEKACTEEAKDKCRGISRVPKPCQKDLNPKDRSLFNKKTLELCYEPMNDIMLWKNLIVGGQFDTCKSPKTICHDHAMGAVQWKGNHLLPPKFWTDSLLEDERNRIEKGESGVLQPEPEHIDIIFHQLFEKPLSSSTTGGDLLQASAKENDYLFKSWYCNVQRDRDNGVAISKKTKPIVYNGPIQSEINSRGLHEAVTENFAIYIGEKYCSPLYWQTYYNNNRQIMNAVELCKAFYAIDNRRKQYDDNSNYVSLEESCGVEPQMMRRSRSYNRQTPVRGYRSSGRGRQSRYYDDEEYEDEDDYSPRSHASHRKHHENYDDDRSEDDDHSNGSKNHHPSSGSDRYDPNMNEDDSEVDW